MINSSGRLTLHHFCRQQSCLSQGMPHAHPLESNPTFITLLCLIGHLTNPKLPRSLQLPHALRSCSKSLYLLFSLAAPYLFCIHLAGIDFVLRLFTSRTFNVRLPLRKNYSIVRSPLFRRHEVRPTKYV